LLTCKDFLDELNAFLDESVDPEVRREIEEHLNECPNCWVITDTTRKTIQVFKGMAPKSIPPEVHARLMAALERRSAEGGHHHTPDCSSSGE
jgi:anti-sigma factor RsiW